ncbi:MAG: cytochrome c, partial [Pseudohongiella sp.]|nr:cytochrome c [Pseudohongiella sp.]
MAKSAGFLFRLAAFAAGLTYSSILTAQTPQSVHPGEQIYQTICAFCHAGGDARAPSLRTLQSMTADMLDYTLTEGLMSAQASGLTDEQRLSVIDYLAAERPDNNWISNN